MNERDIFIGAIQLDDPVQRREFVRQSCAGDAALSQRVEELLVVYEQAGSFPQSPVAEQTNGSLHRVESEARAGARIGPYKLLQEIGTGGMGTVWLAEQQDPVQRQVALKITKPGIDSSQVLARFEAERQALAIMDHPNIAKVLDAGATTAGRPYFVMELVKGVPIIQYCDEQRLTPKQRLELFVPVCQGIQHAHQKGIIHRDIKPSNVLVGIYDGKPVVKIIDFGVAKATGPKLTGKTLFTEFGQVVGTLEYMSPEQAHLDNVDIDTRSDIYSLGVLLYELLTGTTPLTRERLQQAAFTEMLRLIREEEPPKPSTRLSTSEGLPSIAAQRGLEPKKLSGLVRGELDWIVMKALEKDRNRRYATANGFALDVERYLADEPVQACPPSAAYRLRKFARRHKFGLSAVSIVVVSLVAGIIVSSLQAVRATRAERRAQKQHELAEANFRHALGAVDRYFNQVSNSPELKAEGLERLRQDLLNMAKEFYDKFVAERSDDPSLRAELGTAHLELGDIALVLGSRAEAIRHYEEAMRVFAELNQARPDDVNALHGLASSHNGLGGVLRTLRQWDRAEVELGKAVALREQLLASNPDHSRYLSLLGGAYNDLANLEMDRKNAVQAEAAYKKAIAIAERLVTDQPGVLRYQVALAKDLKNLGLLYANSRKYPEAEVYYGKSLTVAQQLVREHPRDPECLNTLARGHNNLAIVYYYTNRYPLAKTSYEEAIRLQRQLAGRHPLVMQYQRDLALFWSYLAALRFSMKDITESEAAYKESISIWERLVQDYRDDLRHQRDLAGNYGNLAEIEQLRGKFELVVEWATKAIDILEAVLKRDPGEATVRSFLRNSHQRRARGLTGLGRHQEALPSWDRAVELADGVFRTQHQLSRAFAHVRAKQYTQAITDATALANEKEATYDTLYGTACVHALVSRNVKDQKELHEQYAAQAIALIRRAASRGPVGAADVKKEEDFEALRTRADFQQLLKELEALEKKKS